MQNILCVILVLPIDPSQIPKSTPVARAHLLIETHDLQVMRVTVRGHNPLLEIDLGCVMCLRCAMQTDRGVARRALAAWGWLRADACSSTGAWS